MPLSSSDLEYEELGTGIASAVGCGLIILTYLFFPNLRELRYIELVFYVAINDLMASIGMALGPSENGSAECWYQGLSSTGSYLSSVFWTSFITYQVYQVVVNEGKVVKNMFYVHCFCWGVPLLLTFIPLTTSTYANPDDETTWCFVADRRGSPPWSQFFWFIVSFYAWLWVAMLWTVFMLVSIAAKLQRLEVVPDVVYGTIGKLCWYPVIITVCWSLNTVANIYTFSTGKALGELNGTWTDVARLGIILATLQGFFNALVFFYMNPLVREHWACLATDLYRNLCCCGCGAPKEEVIAESDNKQIQADLEAARGSDASATSDITTARNISDSGGAGDLTRLNTLRNSTAPYSMGNNNSTYTMGSARTIGSMQSKGLKMIQSVQSQPDFVGTHNINSTFVSINNTNGGGNSGVSNGNNGSGNGNTSNGGSRFDSNGEYMYSVESVSAPITTLMNGLKKTADGK